MTAQRPRRTDAAVFFVVACVLAAAVVPVVAVGGSSGGDGVGGTDGSDTAAVESLERADRVDRPAIGPGLESTNDTVEVVVRFEGDVRTGADGTEGRRPVSTDALKTNAANAQADFERFARANPAVTVERNFWLANAMLVTVDTDRVPIERILDVRDVERVHGNFEVELDSATIVGSDAGSSVDGTVGPESGPTAETASTTSADVDATYGVEMVRAPEVWETFDTRGEGATVAVIDTGVDPDHPDLTVSGWAEYDSTGALVSEGPENAYDDNGHGTHVAGTVAGGNASGQSIGVAPEADLYGIKTFDQPDEGATFVQVLAGMQHATDDPDVDVLQMSLGATGYSSGFIEPVRNARDAGKVVVASAGNSGEGSSSSPGNVYDSVAVGAVDGSRTVAHFSSGETIDTSSAWGSDAPADWPDTYVVPDVSAPGVDVVSSLPGSRYGDKSGTSMAAPHVSGVAALAISATSRTVSDEELYETLRDTANHPNDATDPDARYGTGVVDGYAAVSSITENRSNLTVTGFEAPAETVPGATVETSATINNTGEDPGFGAVEYRFNGTVGDETTVSLGPGEEATVSFSYVVPENTTTGTSYEHGAYTADSDLTTDVTVLETPFYEVSDLSTPSIVERNATLEATANVTNPGVVAGENRTVELRLTDPENESDVRTLDATNVSLEAGTATTVTLHGIVPNDVGSGGTTVAIATTDDDERAAIRVVDAVGRVNGTVIDAETNATLSAVDVEVRNGTEIVGETVTGANGTYAIDVPATDLNVTASNDTYAPATGSVSLNGSGDVATANLSLVRRNGTLNGVVGASDGLAVPQNATVRVLNETGAAIAAVDALADGTYALDLKPGTYEMTATAPNFESRHETGIAIESSETTDRTVQLDPLPATVFGTVTNGSGGEGIGGATVTVGSTAATTDPNGAYSLAIDRGERTVSASAYGYADSSRTLRIEANESRESTVSLAPEPVFLIRSVSGPSEIERGTSGNFDVTIENDGNAAGDTTVAGDVSPGGTAGSISVSGVAAGEQTSGSIDVSIGQSESLGTYELLASTTDDSRTTPFDVVDSTDDGRSDGDDGEDDGGNDDGGDAGGGGGGGGGETAPPPSDDTDDEPVDDGTGSDATNETAADATNETENATDDPVDNGEGIVDNVTNENDDTAADGEVDDGGYDEAADNGTIGDDVNDADETSEDEAPGFGVGVGVGALLAVSLLVRRRIETR